MPIRSFNISDYRKPLGKNDREHNTIANMIRGHMPSLLPSLDVEKLDVYNLGGERHAHSAGRKNGRVVVFINATVAGVEGEVVLQKPEPIAGIENGHTYFLPPKGDGIIISSDKGIPLAEWRESKWELNILFDLFNELSDTSWKIFEYIMKKFEELVWLPKTYENSWKHTSDKNALTQRFTAKIKEQKERMIASDKRELENIERSINDYKVELKRYFDRAGVKRRSIDTEMANLGRVTEGLIKDLDLIINHDKIKDLHIKDNIFTIFTKPLIIMSDKGEYYYGGEYKVTINPENTDVRFFGAPCPTGRGFWSEQDPHPHVDGRTGQACLGNVASTIAELCSQMQMYALALVCIDFLESANTGDSAGKYVVKWNECDRNGNLKNPPATPQPTGQVVATLDDEEEENEDTRACYHCEEHYHIDEMTWVYGNIDEDGELEDERLVCDDCLNEHYTYSDDYEAYIRD